MVAQGSGFYNLPSDGQGYPKFASFRDRRKYIKSSILSTPERIEYFQNLVVADNEKEKQGQLLTAQKDAQSDDEYNNTCNKMEDEHAEMEEEESLDQAEFDNFDKEYDAIEDLSKTTSKFDEHLKGSNVVFVGESTVSFSPHRGDLIIHQPGRDQEFHGRGDLASYEGPHTHIMDGDLVVRIGQYDETRHSKGSYVHKPYETLELYKLNMDRTWQYLGSQARMTDREIDIDTSPGKYLKIGAQFASYGQFHPLVPRRGDVIIKKEARRDDFSHEENFWHSMVKWHRDRTVDWNVGDLLIRLFVDKERQPFNPYDVGPSPLPGDHSTCVLHGECQESHPPPSAGFAELYKKGPNVLQWTYLGKTKLLFDIVSQKESDPHILFYTEDDGQYSDFDMEDTSTQSPWLIKS